MPDFSVLRRHSQLKHLESRHGQRIATAYRKGSCKRLLAAQKMYLHSYAARYIASLGAVMGKRKKVTAKDKMRAHKLANKLSVWLPCSEQVILHPKLKANNIDFRFILRFGEENQARQILVRNMLMHRFNICPEQYLFGAGRDMAVLAAIKHYENGYRFVQEIDVYKAFRSFDVEGIAKFLKLPKKVCHHVLSGTSLNIDLSPSYEQVILHDPEESGGLTAIQELSMMDSDWAMARQGISEGSKVSPFVAELLFAWVVARLPKNIGKLVNYADNFLLLSKSENEAAELRIELRKLLDQHPAGPLTVNPSTLLSEEYGFSF